MQGWIKIHRKFIEWEWYDDLKTKHLFLHLLLSANHKEGKWRGQTIKKGQLITGLYSLSEQTGLSIQSLRTSLKKLKTTKELTIKSTNRFSIITLLNWGKYQTKEKEQQATQQTNNKPTTTNKNDKNEKKIYNIGEPIKYKWQKQALKAVKYFKDGEQFRGRIFKCFKDSEQFATTSFLDCKELSRNATMYFFAVYNNLKK